MIRQNKHILSLLAVYFVSLLFLTNVSGQYEGGEGPGFSYDETSQSCLLNSIYSSTEGDGFNYDRILLNCFSQLFTNGGDGNGFSADTSLTNCLPFNIFLGTGADGVALALQIPCPNDSLVLEASVIDHISCTGGGLGTAYVSVVDGLPYFQSVPDFTYVWKDQNGDLLLGYPMTKSSWNDTVSSLTAGTYTIVVYDAGLKIDSTTIYINDCLYRGGAGTGFGADSSYSDCAPASIFKGQGGDGSDAIQNLESCDMFFFSSGGDGSGFALDTNTQDCLSPNINLGGASDGAESLAEVLNCDSRLFSVGGDGAGYSNDTLLQNCEPESVFRNSGGDGFNYDNELLTCDVYLFSSGGPGNGFAADTNLQDCLPTSIFSNSGNDGFNHDADILTCNSVLFTRGGNGSGFNADTSIQNCDTENIFEGGGGDGHTIIYDIPCLEDSVVINADVLNQISCPVTIDDGSAFVTITEGFPDWRSVPDFTYTWKNSLGDTLPGYPITKSETGDTVYNLGIDDYTVIVTDVNGNTDSAVVYINDCLYRGGEGIGFNTDSSLAICLPPSVYKNSGADGYDYVVDTPHCNFGLFSNGGSGDGFSIDTSYQDCDKTSIYANSGNDGFDYIIDQQNCNVTYFSSGGNGNGFAIDTANQDCLLPLINLGEEGDGADQQYIGCTPYIYEFPATNNTCLIADTIDSDGSDQWQLIMRNGQVVAAIKDNGNNLGAVATEFYINDNPVRIDPNAVLPSYYLDRNFNISAENLILGDPVRVRLYFLTNELQALINADPNVTSISSIGITKYTGTNENCTLFDNIDNNDGFNYLHTTNYTWDTYENGYYVEFDVASFSEFYINNSTSLPEPYVITADISVLSDYNGADVSCYGVADGQAVITPTYGFAPFTYQWDDPLLQTDSIATGLAAGTYHVTIVDNNSVTYTDSITITNPDSITVTAVITRSCAADNTGTVDLTSMGGTIVTDYAYTWSTSDGSGIVPGDEDQIALSAGTYNITIEDDNSCAKDTTVIVLEYPSSTAPSGINVTNNSTCEGTTKTLTPNGGVLGYNAVWRWYADAACTILLYTGNSYDVDPAATISYWLRAEGDCDTTSAVIGNVAVLPASVAADSISKDVDNIAPGNTVILAIHGGSLGDGASWKWYLDAATTSPAGPDNDTLIVNPLVTTQYWARAEGTCGNTALVTTIVTISPLPLKPGTPIGADTLCQDAADTDYITAGASGATSYIWNIYPASAGSISGTGTTGTVDWASDYYEVVSITVTGQNVSGTGPVSDTLKVWLWKIPTTGPQYHISNDYAE